MQIKSDKHGVVVQLVRYLPVTQGVAGSSPVHTADKRAEWHTSVADCSFLFYHNLPS